MPNFAKDGSDKILNADKNHGARTGALIEKIGNSLDVETILEGMKDKELVAEIEGIQGKEGNGEQDNTREGINKIENTTPQIEDTSERE